MFKQAALLLGNAWRYARTPVTKFILSSTGLLGLDEPLSPNHNSYASHATSHRPNGTSRRQRRELGDALGDAELECERIPDDHLGPFASSRSWDVWDICLGPFPPLSPSRNRCYIDRAAVLRPQMGVVTDTLCALNDACSRKSVILRVTPQTLLGLGGHCRGPP